MGVLEIALIVGCVAIVTGVVVSRIVRKKRGGTTCDCGCDCAHCAGCARSAEREGDSKGINHLAKR
ncbi:MAG: hypothetical protein IJU10_04680 [Clostridia bacterium]|nr:hypothetical protein [Clostridia bacterium]